ncbi:PorP/SprF family type IX secretion system membrane protein [Echinicola vietnamensis]|uniref:Bacteroidetes-specific putative membrane protein n=1 Tax=Echinicola vietnamensis (strain DSM 17526 / LMG 23754 / KMM 6221) TaxID=926556 RepID=L0G4X3_ECHVK|nr:type IX secretion system membrane protein PorP/SprF [Echinicola vietnamensis]AGA79880.1 Bacteroidetes-specific putative membrane protein [Echinicola vietnamensis DSM 17526]
MKRIFKITAFSLAFLVTSMVSAQQLPQFSQYMFNGLHINPGYAGYKGESYVQSTYRSQWVNFPGAPKTFTVTGDFSANEGKMGFGFSVMSDRLGPVTTNGILLTYAYRIQTGMRSHLGLGVSAGVSEYAIDGSMLDPNDHPDAQLPEGRVNLFTPNMNTGIFFNTPRFYAGLSMYNLIGKKSLEREDVALAYHDFHYYLTAGAMIPLSEKVQIKPSFLIKEVKGAPTSYDLNAMFLFYERIWLGGSYRSNMKLGKENLPDNLSNRNSIAMILEFFATTNLRIGYAYDHNLNVLDSYRNNSHEISIGYYLTPRNIRMRNQRWF